MTPKIRLGRPQGISHPQKMVRVFGMLFNGISSKVMVFTSFLDPEDWFQKATLLVLVLVVGISSSGPKTPKAFLICSVVQRNFAYTFMQAMQCTKCRRCCSTRQSKMSR